jgi:hypothetical protein
MNKQTYIDPHTRAFKWYLRHLFIGFVIFVLMRILGIEKDLCIRTFGIFGVIGVPFTILKFILINNINKTNGTKPPNKDVTKCPSRKLEK